MPRTATRPTKATLYKKYGDASKYTAKTVKKAMIAELVYISAQPGEGDTPKHLFTDEERDALRELAYNAGLEEEYINTHELMEYLQDDCSSCLEVHKFLWNTIGLISAYYITLNMWATNAPSFVDKAFTKKQKKEREAILSAQLALSENCFGDPEDQRELIRSALTKLQVYNTKVALIAAEIGVPELPKVIHFDMEVYASMIQNQINGTIDELRNTLLQGTGTPLEAYAISERGENLLEHYPVISKNVEEIIPTIQKIIQAKAWKSLSAFILPEV